MSAAGSTTAGTGTLVRFMLRRDRVRLPIWIVGVVGGVLGSASSYVDTYPRPIDRQQRADLIDNPAFALFLGGGHGLDHYTFGAMTANELAPTATLAVAIMSILLVVRHTRAEEESGRAELVRAGAVGRHAPMLATAIVVAVTNLLIGLLLAVGLPGTVDDLSAGGSLLLGLSIAATGLVFMCIALVAVQLIEYSRAATGIALAVLGACLAVKAAGSIAGIDVLRWLSPLGWAEETRAFVDDQWWPLALSVVAGCLIAASAVVLSSRRDVGGGMLAPGLGPVEGSPRLATPFGLAFRLQRSTLIAWAVPLFLFGLMFGGVAEEGADFARDNKVMQDYLAHVGSSDLVDTLLGVYLSFLTVVAAAFAVQAVSVLRREETAGRAEPVLATAVSRRQWTGSHLVCALGGAVVLLLASGLGYGTSRAIQSRDASELPRLIGSALAYAPALWLLGAATVALFGLLPRFSAAPWALFGVTILIAWLGPLLDLPGWVYDLSPFEHIPTLPAEDMTVLPLVVLTIISAALVAAGLAGISRRDVPA